MAMIFLYLAIAVTLFELFWLKRKKVKKWSDRFLSFTSDPEWENVKLDLINGVLPDNIPELFPPTADYFIIYKETEGIRIVALNNNKSRFMDLRKYEKLKKRLRNSKNRLQMSYFLNNSIYYLLDENKILFIDIVK